MKEKDYDKMADAVVRKNYEYRNKISSIVFIIFGPILTIVGIVLEMMFKRDLNEHSIVGLVFIGLGVILLIAGIVWLVVYHSKKKKK